ncbi:MAG: hypothetical protein J5484_02600 [Prevotella sp.]|nr:hypothetical protein [Prevotella sp.]
MKKTILTISALILACLAFYGWKPLLEQPSSPQMQSFYQGSVGLDAMPADSASRFIVDFLGYTMLNPRAKLDPLYPEIETNIHNYSLSH